MNDLAETQTAIIEIDKPAVGVHRNVPASIYHQWPCVSSSTLKRIHTHSPAHCRVPIQPSDEMDIGSAAHCLLFTASEFDSQYIVSPKCGMTTGDGDPCRNNAIGCAPTEKENAYIWLCGVHGRRKNIRMPSGITFLKEEDYERVHGIAGAVRAHKVASDTLDAVTDFELSIVATDPMTGLLLKARMDMWCSDFNLMPDLKTCRSSDPKRFKYQARDFAYHVQIAFYAYVARLAGMDVRTTRIIAVENTAPFAVTCFEPSEAFALQGELDMQAALSTYHNCLKNDEWPAYSELTQILELP